MKQYVIILFIAFHLMSSSAYATKTFLDKDHIHQHSHNNSNHQHKHSHTQVNINYLDFFNDSHDINLYDFSNPKQTYLEIISWIPSPTLKSLFRPPIV